MSGIAARILARLKRELRQLVSTIQARVKADRSKLAPSKDAVVESSRGPANPHGTDEELFRKDGFVVLEGIFEPEFVDALRVEYQRQFPKVAAVPDRYVVGKRRVQVTMRLTGPFLSPALYANPKVLELARSVLGEDILIDNFSLVAALPGAPAQHLHFDHPDLFPENGISRVVPPYGLNVSIPLVDLTSETGTTRLLRGSHKRSWDDQDSVLPYVERGSCYVVDYRLRHQGTENRSKVERPIIYLMYARPWFTDISNYGDNMRICIAGDDLRCIREADRPLFRRLAARGAFDRTVKDLFAPG